LKENYRGNKRRREEANKKKQEEKRNKRLNKAKSPELGVEAGASNVPPVQEQ